MAASLLGILVAAQIGAPEPLYVVLFGALIYALAGLATARSALLTAPVFVYLGEVSYSIYMVCVPVAEGVREHRTQNLRTSGQTLPLPLWIALTLA